MKRNTLVLWTLVALLALGLSLDAQTNTRSSSPGVPIPDATCSGADGAGGVSDTIPIGATTGGLTDVDVRVEIDHTFRSDLQFHVTYSGGGGTVVLANSHGGFTDDNYYATFDDGAGTACATACSSATVCSGAPGATCSPDNALSAFNGLATPGTFSFAICDNTGADTGTFSVWEMIVTGPGLPVELLQFDIQ